MLIEPHQGSGSADSHVPRESVVVPDTIPIFALPTGVFFPKTYLPLHIFEPRYREMVADTAREGQCIGMVLLKEGWEVDYYGNPAIYPIGCVGRLLNVQMLSDGRSNILLQGLERFEIQEQFLDRSYRRARIALKPHSGERVLDPLLKTHVLGHLQQYVRTRDNSHVWQEFLGQGVNDETLVHTISSHVDCTPLEKQFLLESESVTMQARRLADLLQFKLHEAQGVKGWG